MNRLILLVMGLMAGCGVFTVGGDYESQGISVNYDFTSQSQEKDLDWLLRNSQLKSYECRRYLGPYMNMAVTECEQVD